MRRRLGHEQFRSHERVVRTPAAGAADTPIPESSRTQTAVLERQSVADDWWGSCAWWLCKTFAEPDPVAHNNRTQHSTYNPSVEK